MNSYYSIFKEKGSVYIMGIQGLNLFLSKQIPEINNTVNLSRFSNKKIGIDTSIYLYKFKYNHRNFIEGFLKQIYRLKINNITPIYIFDGKPPKEKTPIIQLRKKKQNVHLIQLKQLEKTKESCKNLFEIVIINTQIENLKKKMIKITSEDIELLKRCLALCGIMYIQSESESDFLFGSLYKHNYIDMVISEDNDIIVNSNTILIKYLNIYSNTVKIYDKTVILKKLGLTNKQWIHFCILMGCDYFKRISYSPEKIYHFIKTYHIDDLLTTVISLDEKRIRSFKKSETIFTSFPAIKQALISRTKIDIQGLQQFITQNTVLPEKSVSKIIGVIASNQLPP